MTSGREHHEWWIVTEHIEEAERREVYDARRADRREPSDRPWHDTRLEGIEAQAVIVLVCFVVHAMPPSGKLSDHEVSIATQNFDCITRNSDVII